MATDAAHNYIQCLLLTPFLKSRGRIHVYNGTHLEFRSADVPSYLGDVGMHTESRIATARCQECVFPIRRGAADGDLPPTTWPLCLMAMEGLRGHPCFDFIQVLSKTRSRGLVLCGFWLSPAVPYA